ncbi:MAG TPA: serine/threonine-protein kinase [Myxococcota bacterium]|jgi:serine/threonine-protein kinase|nr:serine/threonine-protein kinase [Myxococcota bacterium]
MSLWRRLRGLWPGRPRGQDEAAGEAGAGHGPEGAGAAGRARVAADRGGPFDFDAPDAAVPWDAPSDADGGTGASAGAPGGPDPERTLRAGLEEGAPEGFCRTAAFRDAVAALAGAGRDLLVVDLVRAYATRHPADYDLKRLLGERLLARGDADAARAVLHECADAPDPALRAWALFELADQQQQRGEEALALAGYQEVLAIDYDYPRARARARALAGRLGQRGPALPLSTTTATSAAPDRVAVGAWRLRRELGRGGAGAVYLALDPGLEREVAVKVLHPHLAARERSRRRFFREARAAAAVAHPGVITIYELDEKLTAIAMQYHAGGSLAEKLRAGPLPPRDALRVAGEVAEALAAIHAAGIVHRDLKPGNVLFRDDGGAVLTDFGVAGLGTELGAPGNAAASADGDAAAAATADGGAVGTLAYMAPEQRTGEPPRAANDLYALGVLLFEMLAGRPPFAAAELTAHPPTAVPDLAPAAAPLEPGLRPHVSLLLSRLLAPDPAARLAGVDEARTDLSRVARWVAIGSERRARYADLWRAVTLCGETPERRARLAAAAADLGILPPEAQEIESASLP